MNEFLRRLHEVYGVDEEENDNGSSRKKVDHAMTMAEFEKIRERTWEEKAAINRAASKNDKKRD